MHTHESPPSDLLAHIEEEHAKGATWDETPKVFANLADAVGWHEEQHQEGEEGCSEQANAVYEYGWMRELFS